MSYGCIIIPVYGSWRRQLPDCRLRFADNTARPVWGSWRTSPQARRIQNVSDCPMLRDTLSLSKYRGLSARKSTQGKICFCGMISTKKSPRRGSGKGSCHIPPCGLLLGCLKGQNLGNQFCFQTAAQFFINAQMWVACFVIHGSCRQFGYVALIVLQDFVDSVHVAGNSRRNYRVGK